MIIIYDKNQVWIIIWQVANGIAVAGLIAALCKLHQSSSMHPGQLFFISWSAFTSDVIFIFMTHCSSL